MKTLKTIWLWCLSVLFTTPLFSTIYEAGQGKTFPTVTDALSQASPGDTIHIFGIITADGNTGNGIVINKNIVLLGQGVDQTIVEGGASLSVSDRRVFSVMPGNTVFISGITIRFGNTSGNGGAIENLGILYLKNCMIESNKARYGGALRNGLSAQLYLENCVLKNNTALLRGGAVNHIGAVLQIERCSIEGNQAFDEGGGVQIENSNAEIRNSLIYNNILVADTVHSNGAGLFAGTSGKAIQISLTNCTITNNKGKTSGNYLTCGGGMGIISSNGSCVVNLINCTFTENTVYCGQSIQAYSYNDPATVHFNLLNCILASGFTDNFFGYTQNGGKITFNRTYTILQDNTILVSGQGNINNMDAELEILADNGGLTKTHALKPTSPAIDAGTSVGAPLLDQRGASRNGKTDIGAVEFGGVIGIRDNDSQKGIIMVYPNPVTDVVLLLNPEGMNVRFKIIDITGRLLIEDTVNEKTKSIDLHNLSSGIYLLLIENSEKQLVQVEKLVK